MFISVVLPDPFSGEHMHLATAKQQARVRQREHLTRAFGHVAQLCAAHVGHWLSVSARECP